MEDVSSALISLYLLFTSVLSFWNGLDTRIQRKSTRTFLWSMGEISRGVWRSTCHKRVTAEKELELAALYARTKKKWGRLKQDLDKDF